MNTTDRICCICEKRTSIRWAGAPSCLVCFQSYRPTGTAAINAIEPCSQSDPLVRAGEKFALGLSPEGAAWPA